jgi:hypothetical protein
MQVHIPASWAKQGYGVPDVCARHGVAAKRRRVDISVQPSSVWLFLLVGVIFFFLVRVFLAKTLRLPAWPVCDRCVRRRRTVFAVSAAVVLLGVAAFAAPFVVDDLGPDLLGIGMLLMIAGLIVLAWAPWATVVGVKADEALTWVTVVAVHPAFEAQFAPFRAGLQEQLQREQLEREQFSARAA